MIPILSRDQIRAYDRHAIEDCRVPAIVLMENAGRGAAEIIAEQLDGEPARVVIVCGRGNNGGDGFVVARHLLAQDIEARVVLLGEGDALRGEARANLEALVGLGGEVVSIAGEDLTPLADELDDADLCVDALLGTGLDRPVEGRYAAAIEAVNDSGCPCVALDIPSGLHADTGAVLGVAIRAEHTITFGAHKPGLLQGAAAEHAGEIHLVGLGIFDAGVLARTGWLATFIEPDDALDALGHRPDDAHKYDRGSVLVVAGSAGKTGAALLAARGALRAGAGIATIASWPDAIASLEVRVLEVMTHALDPSALDASLEAALARRKAVAIGPGLGTDARARELCDKVVLGWEGPVVVDADAISAFAGRPEALQDAPGPRVLTPHSGELARLLGIKSADVEADRFAAAREAARRTGATVLLKGRNTLVATAERLAVCAAGSAVLATAGSGDVLTGIAAALCCHAPAHEAASAAAFLHALTADRWRHARGADRGMVAGDLIEGLPGAIAELQAS